MFNCCCAEPPSLTTELAAHEDPTDHPVDDEVEPAETRDASSFECSLRGDGTAWGMSLDFWSAGLQVVSITPDGGVDRYNCKQPEERQILVHDFITQVNGILDMQQMFQEMQKVSSTAGKDMKLSVARPGCRLVRIDKGEGPLGLNMHYQEQTSTCLKINAVVDGASKLYNEGTSGVEQLRQNDLIERVNQVQGVASDLLAEIKKSKVVEMSVLRLPKEA